MKEKKCYPKQDMEVNERIPNLQSADFASLDKASSSKQVLFSGKIFKLLVAGLVVLLFGTTILFSYKYSELRQQLESQQQALPLPQLTVRSPSPVLSLPTQDGQEQSQTATKSPARDAGLSNIKYTLLEGWVAEIRLEQSDLLLSPEEEGGYLAMKVYSYEGKTGRRAYYCQVTNHCIEATYFTEMKIGNILGYKANALDNSGGGAQYFGAKRDKFYIISSFSPSYPPNNFFDRTCQDALSSLVF